MASAGGDPRIERGMRAQLAERRRRLDAGARPLGWKLGFGTAAAMEMLGTSAPLVGYLLEDARLPSGAGCDVSSWGNARLEPEVAVHLGSDLAGDEGEEAARAAIAGLGAAIELVDPDPGADDPEAILAGNIFQRHVLLGPPRAVAPEAAGLRLRVTRDGAEAAATGDVAQLTGEPVELVRHVAATLAAAGEQLRAGEVVICGSIVPALAIAPGEQVEVSLEPLGALAVRF